MHDYDSDALTEFEAFFREALPVSIRVVRRILVFQTDAEDAASEAFARAFADWPKIRHLEHRLAWVLRVATNLAIDAGRRGGRGRAEWLQPVSDTGDSRLELADHVAVSQALLAALKRLPRRQREAIVLRYLADYSVEEVAESLGMKPGTAKTHLHRGMVALRKWIGPDWEGNEVAL